MFRPFASILAAACLFAVVARADAAAPAPAYEPGVSFRNDVMPIFLVAGCNTGSCHGSARGQDGFRLSLFGYDPAGDFFRLTREMPNRRINLAQPHESLMLLKATGVVPHTGGEVVKKDSDQYRTLLRWIEAGAPDDAPGIPTPTALDIEPKQLDLTTGATQPMKATAKYSDGSE